MAEYDDGALDERDDEDLYADDDQGGEREEGAPSQDERQGHDDGVERRDPEEGDEDGERRRDRAEERKQRRERQRRMRDLHERQVQDLTNEVGRLRAQLGQIDQRTATGQIETSIAQAQAVYQQTQQALREAVESGDVDRQVRLLEDIVTTRRRVEDLTALKERANQPPKPQAPDAAAIRTQAYYDSFVSQNRWFDPNGRDDDSRAAIQISNEVAAAGIPAHDPRHWSEINRRLRDKAPHLFGASRTTDERRAPRQPTGGNGRSTQQGSGPSKGWATPERRQALSEMGLNENDPAAKPYIDAWKSYDRDKSAAGAR